MALPLCFLTVKSSGQRTLWFLSNMTNCMHILDRKKKEPEERMTVYNYYTTIPQEITEINLFSGGSTTLNINFN